eukprot:m.7990 g.7990  ORF g.7990 m.7990 type:complete len:376 (-) comp2493_c0_seq2:23-1150(-)
MPFISRRNTAASGRRSHHRWHLTLAGLASLCIFAPQTATSTVPNGSPQAIDNAVCKGKRLPSKFHGGVEHCVCPVKTRCSGTACSIGHEVNGNAYNNTVHGYSVECSDCRCLAEQPAADFEAHRESKTLWIMGSHHKTGSFLMERVWGHVRREAKPPLKVNVKSYYPVTTEQWKKLSSSDHDVIITFHAENIGPSLEATIHRPYRFIHLVRDPVDQVVSAVLYEHQRLQATGEGASVHDAFYKVVRKADGDLNAAVIAMADFMFSELVQQTVQYETSETDHNALNIRFEDFKHNFEPTFRRIFAFIGVPQGNMEDFVALARKEDLSAKSAEWLQTSRHVTAGKDDIKRDELKTVLLDSPAHRDKLLALRTRMGYQ